VARALTLHVLVCEIQFTMSIGNRSPGSILGLKAQVLGLKAQVFCQECRVFAFCGHKARRCKQSKRVVALSLDHFFRLEEIRPWSASHGNV